MQCFRNTNEILEVLPPFYQSLLYFNTKPQTQLANYWLCFGRNLSETPSFILMSQKVKCIHMCCRDGEGRGNQLVKRAKNRLAGSFDYQIYFFKGFQFSVQNYSIHNTEITLIVILIQADCISHYLLNYIAISILALQWSAETKI